jgi:hypothetical protein
MLSKHGLRVMQQRHEDRRVSAELFKKLIHDSEIGQDAPALDLEVQQLLQRDHLERRQWLDRFESESLLDKVIMTRRKLIWTLLT